MMCISFGGFFLRKNQKMAKTIEWIVKASKLCNLRCRYCYEWEQLSDARKIEMDLWRKILIAIRDYRIMYEENFDGPLFSTIIWHGGEPFVHSAEYWRQVLTLQKEIFPEEWLQDDSISNTVQTNLYAITDEQIDLIIEYGIKVGVSCDFVPGTRMSANGKESNTRVFENLQRLDKAGITFGIITVLSANTRSELCNIHDFLAERGSGFRILPLYRGPDSRPMENLGLNNREIVDSLKEMFVHWFESGCANDVPPLSDYLWVTVMKMLNLRRKPFERAGTDELVIIVNTDGKLHEASHRFGDEDKYYGDLSTQTLNEIFTSQRYAESVRKHHEDRKQICSDCLYFGACNTFPAFAVPDGGRDEGRCQWAQPMMQFIENYLLENGFDGDVLQSLADKMHEDGELYT